MPDGLASHAAVDLTPQLFWAATALHFFLSFWFILQARAVPKVLQTPALFRLAKGQRVDSWLAAAVVWAVILSKGCPVRTALFAVGALILAWLATRTSLRLRVLLEKT